jgi:alkylation response protein AidB-like acyl-CoA dehydrogenase
VSNVDSSTLEPNAAAPGRPAAATLIQRAQNLIPILRERNARTEQARQILGETVDDVRRAGFHLIMHSAEFGGYDYGHDVVAEVTMEVGRGCSSTAWLVCQWASHNFVVTLFPRQAQEEYWAESTDPLAAVASAQVQAEYEQVTGGWRVSGKWRFTSGIDNSDWLILMVRKGNFLIPKQDFRIEDDWFVMGLCGSGSKSVVMENVFVPAYRYVSWEDLVSCNTYAAKHYESPYYRLNFLFWAMTNVSPAVVGTAQGVIDLFEERILKRFDALTQSPAKERPGYQLRFAESTVEVDTARLIIMNLYREFERWGRSGDPISPTDRARVRRDGTYATKLCAQAVDRLLPSGDASAIYDHVLLQRFVRDFHVSALHLSQLWDEPAIQYSRVRWGLESQIK